MLLCDDRVSLPLSDLTIFHPKSHLLDDILGDSEAVARDQLNQINHLSNFNNTSEVPN